PSHAIAVTTVAHVAPVTAAVAGAVFEDPATVIAAALPQPRKVPGRQQLSRGIADQPENFLECRPRSVPFPLESFRCCGDLLWALSNSQFLVQHGQIVPARG